MVDHGVACRPVEPSGRVVDGVESSSCQAAGEHVLGDVVGDLRVIDPSGDEGSQPGWWSRPSRRRDRGSVELGLRWARPSVVSQCRQ